MKLLLAFIFLTFCLSIRTARRGRVPHVWPLLLVSFAVGFAYLARRFI